MFYKEMKNNRLHAASPPASLRKRGEKQPELPHEAGCLNALALEGDLG